MTKQCKNCGKDIPDTLTFCNRECWREYRKKKGIVERDKDGQKIFKDISLDTIKSQDFNIELIKKALETETEIILIPRRSYKIKGIPIRLESNTLRIYVNTGRAIESVLLSEIGHFSFPIELCKKQREEGKSSMHACKEGKK